MVFRGYVRDKGTISSFPAKLDATSGHIVLDGSHDNLVHPRISFVPISGTSERFILPIDDIVELKKVGRLKTLAPIRPS